MVHGPIRIKQPRVHHGWEGHKFTSVILPLYLKRTLSLDALIPTSYSIGEFSEALHAILGPHAKGLELEQIILNRSDRGWT